MGGFAQRERTDLCDLLRRRGPDAPTLCAGWRTADLAAHLVVRERRLLAAAGILLHPLAHRTERAMASVRAGRSYESLVELVRTGPPRWSPARLSPTVERAVNMVEFFVHHEDVRRAGARWEPRTLDPAFEDALWSALRSTARVMTRRAPVGIVFQRRDGGMIRASRRAPAVTLTGRPSELTLFAFGRTDVARVDARGAEAAVDALRAADLGI